MSDLQDALARLDKWSYRTEGLTDQVTSDIRMGLDAARRVADLDYEAESEVLGMYEGPSHANGQIAREIVDGALGITET